MAFVECVKCPSLRTPFLDPSEIVPGIFTYFSAWTHFAHFGTQNIKCLVQTIWNTPLTYTVGIDSSRNDCRYDEWWNLQFSPQIWISSLLELLPTADTVENRLSYCITVGEESSFKRQTQTELISVQNISLAQLSHSSLYTYACNWCLIFKAFLEDRIKKGVSQWG